MNPLEFLFRGLSFLSYETEILESCDWDEDRCEEVKLHLSNALASSADFSIEKDQDSVFSKIEEKLSKNLNEKEVKACLCILERSLLNFNFNKLSKGDTYEN